MAVQFTFDYQTIVQDHPVFLNCFAVQDKTHLPPLDGGVLKYVITKPSREKGNHRDVSD